jgi:hypothetical protein
MKAKYNDIAQNDNSVEFRCKLWYQRSYSEIIILIKFSKLLLIVCISFKHNGIAEIYSIEALMSRRSQIIIDFYLKTQLFI